MNSVYLHKCILFKWDFSFAAPICSFSVSKHCWTKLPIQKKKKTHQVPVKSHESWKKAPPRRISTNQLSQIISCSPERQTVDQWGARTAWQEYWESRSVARLEPDQVSAQSRQSWSDSSPSTGHMSCRTSTHGDCCSKWIYCYIQWNYYLFLVSMNFYTSSDDNTSKTKS